MLLCLKVLNLEAPRGSILMDLFMLDGHSVQLPGECMAHLSFLNHHHRSVMPEAVGTAGTAACGAACSATGHRARPRSMSGFSAKPAVGS